MKKLYPLLSVLFLIYWGCLDPLNIFDSNDEETGPSVNLWGVDYSIENTTVLNLSNSGLTGSIPPEIGNLTNLEWLDLQNNELTGSIPSEIGNLINLERLHLDNNQLTGLIPPEIGNLTNLERLYLNDNQLTGEISGSICDLSNLGYSLYFYGSIIDEGIHFYTNMNQLCPPYPSCIEDYVGEQDISNCWDCEQDGVVELWGNCYSIENTTVLNLSNSGLTGSIPPEIGNLTNLTELDLSGNQLTGSIPPEIGNLTNLRGRIISGWGFTTYHPGLNLSDNLLTGFIPPEIGNLTNLTQLDLGQNELTGSIPSEIGNLTNLNKLNLSGNQLTGVIPESICELTNLTWYSSILFNFTPISSIGNNQLCPPYPSCLQGNYNNFMGTSVPIVGDQDTSDCD